MKHRRSSIDSDSPVTIGIFRRLFDSFDIGIVVLDPDRRIVEANPTSCRMLDRAIDELRELTAPEIVHADDLELFQDMLRSTCNTEEDSPKTEIRFVKKSGEDLSASVCTSTMRNEQGDVEYLVAHIEHITDRKAAELATRESENYYRTLLDSQQADIMVIDRDYRVVDINNSALVTTGQKRSDVIGRKCYEVSHGYSDPCDQHGSVCLLGKVFESGELCKCQHTHIHTNGSKVLVDIQMSPLKNDDGEVTHVMSCVVDVTDLSKAKLELDASESRYQDLVERAQIAIVTTDKDGNITYFNEQFAELFGYAPDEIRDQSISTLAHPDNLEAALDHFRDRIAGIEAESSNEFAGIKKDGSKIYVEVYSSALIEGDTIVGARGYIWDVTARRTAEEALWQSEERFHLAVRGSNDGLWDWPDMNSGKLWWAPRTYELLGYENREFQPTMALFDEMVHPDDREYTRQLFEGDLSDREPFDIERRLRMKSGEYRWFRSRGQILRDSLGRPVRMAGSIQDITDRKQMEEDLRLERDNLKNILGAMVDGIYIVSRQHDIQYVNPALEREFGSPEGMKCHKYFHDLDEPCHFCKNDDVFAGKTARWEWTSPMNHRTYDLIDTPVYNSDGSISKLEIFRDITDRKQAEKEIEESLHLNQTLLDAFPCVALLLRPETREIVASNRAAMEVGAVPGKTCYGTWLGRMEPCPWCQAPETLSEGVAHSCELPLEDETWDMHWIPISDDLYMHFAFDITERRLAEEKIRASEERLNLVLESAQDIILMQDIDGKYLHYSGAPGFGVNAKEVLGKTPYDLHDRNLADTFMKRIKQVVDSGKSMTAESDIIWNDQPICFLDQLSPVCDEAGNIVAVVTISRNITERKGSREALAKSEEKYRNLYESISEGAFVLDREWRFVMVNEVSARQFGDIASRDLLGRKITDIAPHVGSTLFFRGCRRVMDTRTSETAIDRLNNPDSVDRWYEIRIYPSDVGIHCLSRDITDRIEANRKIRTARDQYESLIGNIPDAIYSTDVGDQGHTMFASKRLEEWTGLTADDFAKDPDIWPKLIHPDDVEEVQRTFYTAIKDGREYVLEYRIINVKTQEMRYVRDHGIPHFDCSNKLVRFDGIVSDISVRKRAELALIESEERFRRALDNIPDVVVIYGPDLKIRYINSATRQISGLSESDYVGKRDDEIWPPEICNQYLPTLQQAFSTGAIQSVDVKLALTDSGTRDLRITCVPVVDSDGVVREVLGITHDMTDRIKAEREIRQFSEELELRVAHRTSELAAANRELDSFAHSVAHDLRAPLRAIDGFSHALKTDYDEKLDNEGKRLLNIVSSNAKDMGRLIDALLTLSRFSRQVLDPTSIDMEALARDIFEQLRTEVSGRNIEFKVGALPKASGDRTLIREVMGNLLSNAIKFSATEEVSRIEVKAESTEHEVIYSVHDNGVGFDMKYVNKLFQVFQRLHSVEEFKGSGVGLANVKRIVLRHGGRVWAEGKPGEGAAIYFTLKKG